jgi:uncharacterized protein YukE
MSKKSNDVVMVEGTINTQDIYDTHTKIKEIVESYKEVNLRVDKITNTVNENWVGKGQNEFESQYKLLIKKIEDFGDTLQEIYDGLVDAEAKYESQDDSLRQTFVQAVSS